MPRLVRFLALAIAAPLALATLPSAADAQQRRPVAPRHPVHRERAVVVRGQVFVGGYFYDPIFGPYPWWPPGRYPRWYVPVYDSRAVLRVRVTPERAAVYVDGFYAGIVEDFDGVFEGLPLTPGGHRIVLYLEGYRTARHNVYLRPGSTFKLHDTLVRLPPGVKSDPPELVPPVPPPPRGTYTAPRTPPPVPPLEPGPPGAPETAATGIVDLHVQPAGAEVTIGGHRWVSSDAGHFIVQTLPGKQRLVVSRPGYRSFEAEIDVREGEATVLNVVLMPTS
jgi:hypothetical protein